MARGVGGPKRSTLPEASLLPPLKYEASSHSTGGERIPKEQFLKRSGCNNMKAPACE